MPSKKHKCQECETLIEAKAKRCRACYSKTRLVRKGTLQEYRRNWHLVRKYGVDEEGFEVMYQAFRGCCAICKRKVKRVTLGKLAEDRACIDHNHLTGNIRGILCHKCNTGLGMFLDNPALLQKAKDYLNGR